VFAPRRRLAGTKLGFGPRRGWYQTDTGLRWGEDGNGEGLNDEYPSESGRFQMILPSRLIMSWASTGFEGLAFLS